MNIISHWVETNVYPIPSKGLKYAVWSAIGLSLFLVAAHYDYSLLVK